MHQQLELLRAQVRPPPKPKAQAVATHLPVARVAVDVPLPHLDRPFDYLVPADLDDQVVPGCRVSVRFSGKLVRGFVLERIAESEHEGSLGRIAKAVSPEVVLRPDIIALVRQVADRYAGTFSDVVRLAVPPRHARTEQRVSSPTPPGSLPPLDISPWERYDGGAAFARDLAAGRAPRACWG
ncbi:MAG: primosome assembly protein PriA, partial [Nocardioidaceae bacterium]|nr:primosome assembly protein PriA [Nocardioidaceae bacterium]